MVGIVSKLREASPVLWKLFFKLLSNLSIHIGNSVAVTKSQDMLFDVFARVPISDHSVLALFASFLMTFSANFDVVPSSNSELAAKFNSLIGFLLSNDSANSYGFDITSKLSIALINFTILGKSNTSNSNSCA
jgi:hypothetical protein